MVTLVLGCYAFLLQFGEIFPLDESLNKNRNKNGGEGRNRYSIVTVIPSVRLSLAVECCGQLSLAVKW